MRHRHVALGWLPVVLLACQDRTLRALDPHLEPLPAVSHPTGPASARGYFLRALALESAGDLVGAEEALRWAIRLDPQDPDVYLAAARLFARQKRDELALGALGAGLDHALLGSASPDDVLVWLDVAGQVCRANEVLDWAARSGLAQATSKVARDAWQQLEDAVRTASEQACEPHVRGGFATAYHGVGGPG